MKKTSVIRHVNAQTYIRYHPYNHRNYHVMLVQWCFVDYPIAYPENLPGIAKRLARSKKFHNLGRHQTRSCPMWLGQVLQYIRAHQHPESDSINVLFTTMLDQHTRIVILCRQPEGVGMSGVIIMSLQQSHGIRSDKLIPGYSVVAGEPYQK